MSYRPISDGDRDYVARRMADGLTEQEAWDMLDEHLAMIADDMRDFGRVDDE